MTSINFNYGINTDEGRAALVEFERMALTNAFRHHNERCVPVFQDVSDYIAHYAPGVWGQIDRVWTDIDDPKFDRPQPVSLTPGALGVRCEE